MTSKEESLKRADEYGRSISFNNLQDDNLTTVTQQSPAEQSTANPTLSLSVNRLPSYASAPSSTLSALRAIAEEEKASGNPNNPTAAAAPVDGEFTEQQQSPFAASTGAHPRTDFAWLHRVPPYRPGEQASMAGDLAGIRTPAFTAALGPSSTTQRSLSPAGRRPLGSPMRQPIARPMHRRSVNIIEDNDSSDDDDALGGKANKLDKAWDAEDLDVDAAPTQPRGPLWRQPRFWAIFIPIVVMLVMITAGACYLVYKPGATTADFQVWRLFFFIAGLPIIWWTGDITTRVIVWAVEKSMFNVKNALYFIYAVRKPSRNVLRAALALGWWALIMMVDGGTQSSAVKDTYMIILKLWACVTLFMTANLLKTLLAKMMALKFNKESHFRKMQDTLRQETWLRALLTPRQTFGENGEDGQDIGGATKGFMGSFHMRRAVSTGHMAHDPGASLVRRASSNLGDAILFWRRKSEPLPIIEEEGDASSVSHLELVKPSSPGAATVSSPGTNPTLQKQGSFGSDTGSPPSVKIQIDDSSSASPSPKDGAPIGLPNLPPVRLSRGRGANGSVPSIGSPGMHQGYKPDLTPRSGRGGMSPPSRPGSDMSRLGPKQPPAAAAFDGPVRRDELMSKMAKLERHIRKTTLEVTYRDALNQVKTSGVTNEAEAKRIASYMHWNITKTDFEPIKESDLEPFLPEQDVGPAFQMLDADGDGAASPEECVIAVQKIFQDRKNLASSLQDTRSITASLEILIGIIIHIIFVFFYLLIFQAKISQLWVSFSGVVLAFSFMFGNSVRQTYENATFLFGVHPYDIGDKLLVDGEPLIVEEITINFTCCLNGSNQKVWVPNQHLITTTFINMTASDNRWESIKVLVDFDTPATVVDVLNAELQSLLTEFPKEYASFVVSLCDAAVPMKMTVSVGMQFSHAGVDAGRTSKARTVVFARVAQIMGRLGVQYTWPAIRGAGSGLGGGLGGGAVASAAAAAAATVGEPAAAAVVPQS